MHGPTGTEHTHITLFRQDSVEKAYGLSQQLPNWVLLLTSHETLGTSCDYVLYTHFLHALYVLGIVQSTSGVQSLGRIRSYKQFLCHERRHHHCEHQ